MATKPSSLFSTDAHITYREEKAALLHKAFVEGMTEQLKGQMARWDIWYQVEARGKSSS